jgi:hypothetical protein
VQHNTLRQHGIPSWKARHTRRACGNQRFPLVTLQNGGTRLAKTITVEGLSEGMAHHSIPWRSGPYRNGRFDAGGKRTVHVHMHKAGGRQDHVSWSCLPLKSSWVVRFPSETWIFTFVPTSLLAQRQPCRVQREQSPCPCNLEGDMHNLRDVE